MAVRFTIGGLGRFLSFLRPRWGVRGSLFAAFAVIAAMAIVISACAGLVLGHLGGAMLDLSGRDIPRLAASLQLSAQSASLASQGPALLASESEDALNERSKKMKETQQVTLEKLGEIIELGADKTVVAALTETVKNIDDTIKSLGSAARERLGIVAQRGKQYDALRSAQAGFVAAAAPAMMDAQTQINAILQSANLSPDDATQAARTVEQLGNVFASGNLAGSQMIAALSANSSDTLEAIEKEFKAAQAQVKSNLDLLPKNAGTQKLTDAAAETAGAGRGQDRRLQTSPEGTGRQRLRPDHPGRNPQAQCRPRHQRAAARGRRAERDQRLDLAGAPRDFAGDHRHAGARRPDADRIRAVRLALCRPQHPAPDRQPAALDAASVRRRPRVGDLSFAPARRNRGDGEFAGDFPREHDPGPRAFSRSGQGSHRQGRTRLPHGGPDRRIRNHGACRAGHPCRNQPIPCRPRRKACRRPPTNPARW